MDDWKGLVDLGHVALVLPAAAALTAMLLASRAGRLAWWWSLSFSLAIGLVAASKVAYMGWGAGLPDIGFKALSGHAAGAAALFPMLFYLLLPADRPALRISALACGAGVGMLVAVLLVLQCHHSRAEALAGYGVGLLACAVAIRQGGAIPPLRPLNSALAFALVFGAGLWLMQSAPLGWWMIKAARRLSGSDTLFSIDFE